MQNVYSRIGRLFLVILFTLLLGCSEKQESGYSEEIIDAEDGFTMKMAKVISPAPDQAYMILTDFNHFTEFMPHCSAAKVLETEGNKTIIETSRFIKFLGKNLAGKLEYHLFPNKIVIRSLNHPLADFKEEWSLEPHPGSKGTQVRYHSFSKMKIPMPDYMCQAWLRNTFKETLAAVEARAGQSSAISDS